MFTDKSKQLNKVHFFFDFSCHVLFKLHFFSNIITVSAFLLPSLWGHEPLDEQPRRPLQDPQFRNRPSSSQTSASRTRSFRAAPRSRRPLGSSTKSRGAPTTSGRPPTMLPVLWNIKMDICVFRPFMLFEIRARYLDWNLMATYMSNSHFKIFGRLFFFWHFVHFNFDGAKQM